MKCSKILLTFLSVFTLVACEPDSDKIIDPSNPNFDPLKFSYDDYGQSEDMLIDAIRTMFPVGTNEQYVDEILVEIGGGNKRSYLPNEIDQWGLIIKQAFQKENSKNAVSQMSVYQRSYDSKKNNWFALSAPGATDVFIFFDQSKKVIQIYYGNKPII